MKLVVTGGIAFDRIMDFSGEFSEHILPDKIHSLSVSFNISALTELRGGTAGNVAHTLALLGTGSQLVASVGYDAADYVAALEQRGVDCQHVVSHSDVTSAGAYIITDQANNQITGFFMGALERQTTYDGSDLQPGDAVILTPGNVGDMLRLSAACQQRGATCVFDPGQTLPFFQPQELSILLERSALLLVNDYEFDLLQQRSGWSRQRLLSHFDQVIVTLGSKGSDLYQNGAPTRIACVPAKQFKDPTGAGDAYRSGVLRGMQLGLDWSTAAQIGATAASYAVERHGTQEHQFTIDQFARRYRAAFGVDCPLPG